MRWPGLAAALLCGCAHTGAAVRPLNASVSIDCPVGDARVYINDRFCGRAAELARTAVPVAAGTLRVELRADGYFTAYRDLLVGSGAHERLHVDLRRVPTLEPGG
jgi:hypothetical protein